MIWLIAILLVGAGVWWIARKWKPWDEPPKDSGGNVTPPKRDFRNPSKTFGREDK